MSGLWMSWIVWLRFLGCVHVAPWSVERTRFTLELKPLGVLPVNRDQGKYTTPSQRPLVRSTSIAVLSLNLPSRLGADEPLATVSVPAYCLPSSRVLPVGPFGLT